MRWIAAVTALSVAGCGGSTAATQAKYDNAISCWWSLKSRAGMYRAQGFSDVPEKMEARSELYENEVMIAGSKIDKDQKQVLLDMQAVVGQSMAEAKSLTTEEEAQIALKKLNDKADACFDAPPSAN